MTDKKAQLGHSSLLEDLEAKSCDAEARIGGNFAAFVTTEKYGSYFLCGGDSVNTHLSNKNFKCIIIGASAFEINTIEQQIMSVGSEISSLFSEREFHGTVVSTYLSEYLREELHNMKVPRAIAAEIIMLDRRDVLTRVFYSGDLDVDRAEDIKEPIIVGCYDTKAKKELEKVLEKAPRDNINQENLMSFSKLMFEELKLKYAFFIS